MAKGKGKVLDKLRLYYRGPRKEPTRVASDDDMELISKVLVECVPQRFKSAFKVEWEGESLLVRLVIGLSAGLRHAKRKETIALMFDSTASDHLANMLSDLANKQGIPIVKVHSLINLAPQMKLKTLLLLSLVRVSGTDVDSGELNHIESASLNQLVFYIQRGPNIGKDDKYSFKIAQLDQVKSTGRSRLKKATKRKQQIKKEEMKE